MLGPARPLGSLGRRPQPEPASSIKAGFNCSNKCLPGSFFFPNREGQHARICKFRNGLISPLHAIPRREPQSQGWSSERYQQSKGRHRPAPQSCPRGLRTPSRPPTARLHQTYGRRTTGLGTGWVDIPSEGAASRPCVPQHVAYAARPDKGPVWGSVWPG